jgi:hypothetical protein
MRIFAFAVSIASLLSGAALAQTETAPPGNPAPAAAEQPAVQKVVCIDEDAGGNSRLGSHRVCHTQKEWDSLPRSRR